MYGKPKHTQATPYLFVGNCGPLAGISVEQVNEAFKKYGIRHVHVPDHGKSAYVFVHLDSCEAAALAMEELSGKPCAALAHRVPCLKYAVFKQDKVAEELPVSSTSEQLLIPGIRLYHDFVTEQEEKALVECVEGGSWETLARRRVQHYGFKFKYEVRGVDCTAPITPFPEAVVHIVERLKELPDVPQVDQLTVNEYSSGVGLSPHIDTHSAFTGSIVSLSLLSGTVMEFRREDARKALWLPPRSLLVLGGEGRYAWQHYIPHRKTDSINGQKVARGDRRISFTFRQVRGLPCDCAYPTYCDSQQGCIPPTRMALQASSSLHTTPHNTTSHTSAASATPTSLAAREPAKGASNEAAAEEAASTSEPLPTNEAARRDGFSDASRVGASNEEGDGKEGIGRRTPPSNGERDVKEGSGVAEEEGTGERSPGLEEEFVHNVYDAIAGHFSATRFAIWPKVREFIDWLPPFSLVADVGCGNGKYFGVRADLAVLGSDRSPGLAGLAARKLNPPGSTAATRPRADVCVADALKLPYTSGSCDGVLCIAVLHHISSVARRLQLLRELLRVLRTGGRAIVTVWALEQEDDKKLKKWEPIQLAPSSPCTDSPATNQPLSSSQPSTDYFVPWHVPLHRADASIAAAKASGKSITSIMQQGTTDGNVDRCSSNDTAEPSSCAHHKEPLDVKGARANGPSGATDIKFDQVKGAIVLKRYYHLFREGELEGLVLQLTGLGRLVESFYDKSNWCVVMERT